MWNMAVQLAMAFVIGWLIGALRRERRARARLSTVQNDTENERDELLAQLGSVLGVGGKPDAATIARAIEKRWQAREANKLRTSLS
jgi:hypothetical protein